MANIFDQPERPSTPRELIPEGKYGARLYMIVDLGTHPSTWEGVTKNKHEIYLAWELIGEKMSDGRPFTIGKRYTITDGMYGPYLAKTSNLNKTLRAWLGLDEKQASKAGKLADYINKEAAISISQEPSRKDPNVLYNVIESIKPWKGKELGPLENQVVVYGMGPSKENPGENWDKLYPYQQKIIMEALEWNGGVPARVPDGNKPVVAAPVDDDIPF